MGYKDLRDWLAAVEKMGELKQINGAHWDKELGAISEMMAENTGPALLFDKIKDYPQGYRVLVNAFQSLTRTASVLGVPKKLTGIQMVDAFRQRLKKIKPIPPIEVKKGPIFENTMTGKDVDLLKFPTPLWHELDGGRFLGTGCAIVTRDPDEGWINVGTYRCRVFDKNTIGVGINPGKHATMMTEKYHDRGKAIPIAIICGMDPTLFLAACSPITGAGESEYDFAGFLNGEAVEVVKGKATGLPIPAGAEIVIEGEIPPPPKLERRQDGPFGEWRRTYSSTAHPVMNVKSISYRNDPIILGVPPWKMHIPFPFAVPVMASEIWNVLEYAGIPDVKGVWFGLGLVWPVFVVISIKQSYNGHAKQAAVAAASCRANTVGGMFVVVVDDDIDITNEKDVLWAIASRTNLDNVQIINGIQTKAGGRKSGKPSLVAERVVIDACWPYEHRDKFPVIHSFKPEYQAKIKKKWKELF